MSDYLQPHGLKHRLPKFAQTRVHWVRDAIQPSHPLLPLLLLSSVFPSIRVFFKESALHIRWPEYWSFSFSISPSSEYSGLIPLGLTFNLLAVQGTLKSLLQHNWKTAVLRHSVVVQLSHPYMTTGKITASTVWTFVSKLTSLFFNTLSRFVIAFLPKSSCLLISWLQSPSTVILEPKKRKSVTASTFSPFYFPWSDWIKCHDLSFLMLSFMMLWEQHTFSRNLTFDLFSG